MKKALFAMGCVLCCATLLAGTAGRARDENGQPVRTVQRIGSQPATPQPVAAPVAAEAPVRAPVAVEPVSASIRYAILLSPGRTNYIAHVSGAVWRLVMDETERGIASKLLARSMP